MCRLLYIKSRKLFQIPYHLHIFAGIARNSKEYQGHGWGLAYIQRGEWKHYRNINPVWEDNLDQFGETDLILAHARSAFQDRDIAIENNMPFYDDRYVFIFNGELHGVKINAAGRIGAEKIFNFIKRFNHGNMAQAIIRARAIIEKRSNYIRAMNLIIADRDTASVASMFNEEEEYFTMYYKESSDGVIICSEKYPDGHKWLALENRSVRVFQ